MQNMSSRLFLTRFQPETTEVTENVKEAQEIIDALAACDSQTAVENDMKVQNLFNYLSNSLTLPAHSCMRPSKSSITPRPMIDALAACEEPDCT